MPRGAGADGVPAGSRLVGVDQHRVDDQLGRSGHAPGAPHAVRDDAARARHVELDPSGLPPACRFVWAYAATSSAARSSCRGRCAVTGRRTTATSCASCADSRRPPCCGRRARPGDLALRAVAAGASFSSASPSNRTRGSAVRRRVGLGGRGRPQRCGLFIIIALSASRCSSRSRFAKLQWTPRVSRPSWRCSSGHRWRCGGSTSRSARSDHMSPTTPVDAWRGWPIPCCTCRSSRASWSSPWPTSSCSRIRQAMLVRVLGGLSLYLGTSRAVQARRIVCTPLSHLVGIAALAALAALVPFVTPWCRCPWRRRRSRSSRPGSGFRCACCARRLLRPPEAASRPQPRRPQDTVW